MSDPNDDDEHLALLFEYVPERINLIYAYSFCCIEFIDDDDFNGDPSVNDRSWLLRTIQNGCLHASLIALRDLDDFLQPRNANSKPDDLKASDFGYHKSQRFLTDIERTKINKLIAHATTMGAQQVDFRWDIWELVSKCTLQCVAFLEWIEKHHATSNFRIWTAAMVCRGKTQIIHSYVSSEIQKRKDIGHSDLNE